MVGANSIIQWSGQGLAWHRIELQVEIAAGLSAPYWRMVLIIRTSLHQCTRCYAFFIDSDGGLVVHEQLTNRSADLIVLAVGEGDGILLPVLYRHSASHIGDLRSSCRFTSLAVKRLCLAVSHLHFHYRTRNSSPDRLFPLKLEYIEGGMPTCCSFE